MLLIKRLKDFLFVTPDEEPAESTKNDHEFKAYNTLRACGLNPYQAYHAVESLKQEGLINRER